MNPSHQETDGGQLATVHDILLRLCADLEDGALDPVEHYLAAFPGQHDLVRREYEAALNEAAPAADDKSVGPYVLVEEIGRGGQAIVWRARDTRLSREVALKMLRPTDLLASAAAVARFRREAEILSRLEHPGICTIFEIGTSDRAAWIAMRLLKGRTLAQVVTDEREHAGTDAGATQATRPAVGKPWLARMTAIVEKAARAIDAAHQAGIIHRDLKPGNIMIEPGDETVVLDFGLASAETPGSNSLTQSGDIVGTPAFMAPEQVRGASGAADRRVDVYALGVVLYECCTLARPFEAPTREALYRAILNDEPSAPGRVVEGIPPDLQVVIETAMAKEPDRRYQTALDLAEDLRRLRTHEPIRARPPSAVGKLIRWARRRPAVAAVVALLLLGVPLVTGLGVYIAAQLPVIRAQEAADASRAVERELEAGFGDLADGDPARSIAAFNRALALRPHAPEAVAGVALARLRLRDPSAALAVLDQHPSVERETPGLVRLRADVVRALGREDEARTIEARCPEPADSLGWFLAGSRLVLRGHETQDLATWRAARVDFEQAIRLAPIARALYHFELAHVAGHAHDLDTARAATQAIRHLWPDHEDTLWWSGVALMDVDPPAAAVAFRQMIERNPANAQAMSLLARITANQGQLPEAEALFRRAIALRPDRGELHHELGYALLLQQKVDDAIVEYRQATVSEPRSSSNWQDLAAILMQAGHAAESLSACEQAIQAVPQDGAIRFAQGIALSALGRRAESKAAYEACLARDPNHAEAHCNLGLMLREEGRFRESLDHLRRGHEIGSKRPDWTYDSASWVREAERLLKDEE